MELENTIDVRGKACPQPVVMTKKALESLREKEEKSKAIYKRIYGFNLGKSFDPFDLVLDTDNLSEDEVFQVLCMVLENVALRQN